MNNPILYNLSIERFTRVDDKFLIEAAAPEVPDECVGRTVTKDELLKRLYACPEGLIMMPVGGEVDDTQFVDVTLDEWIQQNNLENELTDLLNEKEGRVRMPKVPSKDETETLSDLHTRAADLCFEMRDKNVFIELLNHKGKDTISQDKQYAELWQDYLIVEAKIVNLQKSRK